MTTNLIIKKSTNIVDASKETDNAIYEVRYYVNDIKGMQALLSLHAEVYERNPDDGSMLNIGGQRISPVGKLSFKRIA